MDIGYITDIGNVRTENQDRLSVFMKKRMDGDVVMCAVADGMGGTGDGSIASETTVQHLQRWWGEEMPSLLAQQHVYAVASDALDELLRNCNEVINEYAGQRQISTGTTLSLLFAFRGQMVIKHVGDTRIYLARGHEWIQLTRDHTWEQQEYQRGNDPHEDKDYEKKKNALINALGAGQECTIDTQMMQMSPDDKYLICSDGFYRYFDLFGGMLLEDGRAQLMLEKAAGEIRHTRAVDNFTAVLLVNKAME